MSTKLPEQFDLSARDRRLVEDRAKLRAEYRAEFIKQSTNPHRHGHGGYLFDPVMQRWQSMKAQQWYYFKPNPKTFWVPGLVFLSCFAYGHWFTVRRAEREKLYREGKVSYRDREFKFI